MAVSIRGIGLRWGVNGVTFTGGIVTATNGEHIQSASVNRTSDSQEVRNSLGEVVGMVFYNQRKELSVSMVPSNPAGTVTQAAGKASVDAHVIPSGTTVTIVDSDGTTIDGLFGGAWVCTGSRLALSNTGVAVVDLDLTQNEANDMSIVVT